MQDIAFESLFYESKTSNSMKKFCCIIFLLITSSLGQVFLDEQYESGFFPLCHHRYGGELFYILFKSRDENPTAPLVWVLEGGPGMSGMQALFHQGGPFRMDKNKKLSKNEFSFNNIADVLYIDQPLGTGFSNVTNVSWIPHNEEIMVHDLEVFLTNFLNKHTEYHGRDLYLVSQGYGSHFLLPLASILIRHLVQFISLKGIALGNAWVRPELQIRSLSGFSKKHQLCNEFHYISSLYGYILSSIFVDLDEDMQALDLVNMGTGILVGTRNHKFNRHDIRIKCDSGNCDYNFSDYEQFIQRADVRRAMGTTGRPFQHHSFEVFRWFIKKNEYFSDKSNSLIDILENSDIPVYIYTGMHDWWINYYGMDELMDSLHWSGREDLANAPWLDWYANGEWHGRYKKARNLYYVHVVNSGHFVAMDQPAFAQDLITRMTFGSNQICL